MTKRFNLEKTYFYSFCILLASLGFNFHFSLVLKKNIPLTFVHFLIFANCVFLVIYFLKNKNLFSKYKIEIIHISLFAILSFISLSWSQSPKATLEYSFKYLLIPMSFAQTILFFELFKDNGAKTFFRIILWVLLISSVVALLEYIFLDKANLFLNCFKSTYFYPRISSTFNTVNPFGVFMAIGLGLIMTGYLLDTYKNKKLFFLTLFLTDLAIALSGSRNSYVVVLVNAVLIFIYFKFKATRLILTTLVLFTISLLAFEVSTNRVGISENKILPWGDKIIKASYKGYFTLFRSEKDNSHNYTQITQSYKLSAIDLKKESSFSTRILLYKAALRAFTKSAIFGIGTANFLYHHNEYGEVGWDIQTGMPEYHAHNVFLNILSENGLVGFILFFGWIGLILIKNLSNKLSIGLLLMLAGQIFDFFLGNNAQLIFFMGALAALAEFRFESKKNKKGKTIRS